MTPMSMDVDEPMKQDKGDDSGSQQATCDDGDSRSNSSRPQGVAYCTFAVTGTNPSFQPIFICHDCFHEETLHGGDTKTTTVPLCICQACADICHDGDDHDVEYIGMGPCYCDCDHSGHCTIKLKSNAQANRLLPQKLMDPKASSKKATTNSSTDISDHLQEAFDIPCLQNPAMSAAIAEEAKEIIRHSKETFWLDRASILNSHDNAFCTLETLAWKIYQSHLQQYETLLFPDDYGGGAEWWVQVKDPSSMSGKDGAVDLHYDKDEALAEVFGLGSFPILSTVTYITSSSNPSEPFNPTIVLDHTYTQGEDDMINSMLVSKPRLGKHLVFDGKLLHGAPAHKSLRTTADDHSTPSDSPTRGDAHNISERSGNAIRITFLVNIWKQKPAKVQPLPYEIRDILLNIKQPDLPHDLGLDTFLMCKREIPVTVLEKEEDLPEHLRKRIELPFVCQGATWEDQLSSKGGDDGEEDVGGLVVVTFPPPPSKSITSDTMIVKFGPGLQAYLDYSNPETPQSPEGQNFESTYV